MFSTNKRAPLHKGGRIYAQDGLTFEIDVRRSEGQGSVSITVLEISGRKVDPRENLSWGSTFNDSQR